MIDINVLSNIECGCITFENVTECAEFYDAIISAGFLTEINFYNFGEDYSHVREQSKKEALSGFPVCVNINLGRYGGYTGVGIAETAHLYGRTVYRYADLCSKCDINTEVLLDVLGG